MPNARDAFTTMLDLGANVDCTPEHLLQFALMGSALAAAVEGTPIRASGCSTSARSPSRAARRPKQAAELLRRRRRGARPAQLPRQRRGQMTSSGHDRRRRLRHFVGNIVLKSSEGLATMLAEFIRQEFTRTAARSWRRSSRFQCSGTSRRGSTRGATTEPPCSDLRGSSSKSHGSADAFAFEHALHRAYDAPETVSWRGCMRASTTRCRPCRPRRRGLADDRPGPELRRMTATSPRYSRIAGTGGYLPSRRVTNAEFARELAAKGIETSDEVDRRAHRHPCPPLRRSGHAVQRSGRPARRGARDRSAGRRTSTSSSSRPRRPTCGVPVDRASFRTSSASTAVLRSTMQAVCSGFLRADRRRCHAAHRLGAQGPGDRGRGLSRILDFNDRTTCVLFGDGRVPSSSRRATRRGSSPPSCTPTGATSASCACRAPCPAERSGRSAAADGRAGGVQARRERARKVARSVLEKAGPQPRPRSTG